MRSLASFTPLRAFLLSAFLSAPTVALSNDAEPASQFTETIRPMLVEFCGDCHDPEDDEDPVRFLRSRTADEVAQHRGIWEATAEQLRNRTMPPGDEPQPSEAQRLRITQWIESHLDATACSQGDFAGAPVPRRLNRQQYTCAIEDLTGEEFDFVETIPADGSGGEGFTNNGETLFLPPLLMERYMEVTRQILDHIVVTEPFDVTYVPRKTGLPEVLELVDETEAAPGTPNEMQPGSKVSVILLVHTG